MHVKLAYAGPVAAVVAMPAGCRNSGAASKGSAAANERIRGMSAAGTGRIGRTRSADSGRRDVGANNAHGARPGAAIHAHMPAFVVGHLARRPDDARRAGRRRAAGIPAGTQVAAQWQDSRGAAAVGHLHADAPVPASDTESDSNIVQTSSSSIHPDHAEQASARARALVCTRHDIECAPRAGHAGRTGAASSLPAMRAALGNGAQIILGGGGVKPARVVERAASARRNRSRPGGESPLPGTANGADVMRYDEARLPTPAQAAAPFMRDAVCVNVDARKRAASAGGFAGLSGMPSTERQPALGGLAGNPADSRNDGAKTLYDFKEARKTVLDVVTK